MARSFTVEDKAAEAAVAVLAGTRNWDLTSPSQETRLGNKLQGLPCRDPLPPEDPTSQGSTASLEQQHYLELHPNR